MLQIQKQLSRKGHHWEEWPWGCNLRYLLETRQCITELNTVEFTYLQVSEKKLAIELRT